MNDFEKLYLIRKELKTQMKSEYIEMFTDSFCKVFGEVGNDITCKNKE